MALRQTKFMDKTADRAAKGLLGEIITHPKVRLPFLFFAVALAEHFNFHDHPIFALLRNPKLDAQWKAITPHKEERLPILCFHLLDLIEEHMPRFHRVCDGNPILAQQIALRYLELAAGDESMKEAISRLSPETVKGPVMIGTPLPDNPITITEDRTTSALSYEVREGERPTRKHWQEIASLEDARWPARPRGRPRKPTDDKPAKRSTRALPDELADRAYEMDQKGEHWRKIAQACYPHLKPAELRTRKIEKRIRRLIEKGALQANRRKKSRTE